MTKNYKILTSYVKDISSKINDTESYIYLKYNIPKFSLGIDINSIPLKNNMAEVDIKLNFSNKSEIDQILMEGSIKARKTASNVLKRVRSKLGYL